MEALQEQGDIIDSFVEQVVGGGSRSALDEYSLKYPHLKKIFEQKYELIKALEDGFKEDGLAGAEIGDYLILEEVGRGGMGVVYLALQRSLGRYVALKVLPFGLSRDIGSIRRFQAEAQTIAKFNHPNIVPIFSTSEEKGIYYIAMAFIPGLSLNKIIEGLRTRLNGEIRTGMVRDIILEHPDFVRINAEEAKTSSSGLIMVDRDQSFWSQSYLNFVFSLCSEVADALRYAHRNGICHGDVKPSNIMLSAGGVPMLVDFGLAKDMRSLTSIQSADFIGTIAYASPEHLARNTVSEKSDIWSLGVTMYEMITLRQPFRTEDVASTLQRIENFEPPLIRASSRRFPKDAEAVVFRCLEKAAGRRYDDAERLKEDIENVLASRPVKARSVGKATRLFKWIKRNPLVSCLLCVLLMAAVMTPYIVINSTVKRSIVEGDRLIDGGKYEEAVESYRKALNRLRWIPFAEKDRVTIMSDIGYALFEKGDYDQAITSYEAVLQLDPNYVAGLQGLGDVYSDMGLYKKTIAYYNKVLILSPQDRNSYYQRGRAYKAEGLYSEALKDFRSAIMIAKNDLETAKEVYDILQKEKLSTDGRRRAYLLRAGFDDVQIRTILQAKRH
jgi:serine/threonine protein kinase